MLEDGRADGIVGKREADWMRRHLTPIRPRSQGVALVKHYMSGTTWWRPAGILQPVLSWFYTCDRYDPDTRQCTDFDNRPKMCREYPWTDAEPVELRTKKSLPPTCSFREDIGQPVEPFPPLG
jgi:Fe-S-cluster containining protein